MFQTKVVQKIKIHILCSVTFIFENRTVYEIWKNIVEGGGGGGQATDDIIWRVHFTYWVIKTT